MFIQRSGMQKLESEWMSCLQQSCNELNQYAVTVEVAVVKDGVVVGHLFIVST